MRERAIIREINYLEQSGLSKYVDMTRASSPEYSLRLANASSDFDLETRGERGGSYRRAQEDPSVRAVGIKRLLQLALSDGLYSLPSIEDSPVILDSLGGDGLVARANRLSYVGIPADIITSDIDAGMVEAARAYGLPAIQQPAEYLIMKDESMDGVLMAYGSHHIEPSNRQQAVNESFRVLKPGGTFVLHDFEENSAVARWFANVVDRYSATGHKYKHFTQKEMKELFTEAGFTKILVGEGMYDPFRCTAPTLDEAVDRLADYLLDMYGLVKLNEMGQELARKTVLEFSISYFGKLHTRKPGRNWQIEMPRRALVASGTKPWTRTI